MPNWDPEANDLFLRAIEIAAPEDRRRFLDGGCAGKPDLRDRVDRLLRAGEEAGSFLEHPAVDPSITDAHVPSSPDEPVTASAEPGTIIGRYKLLEAIGEGGMGTVWMAEQTEPVRRKVALKVVKSGMDSRQVLARFEAERQALALMDHPNIAKVLDGGATADGRPYFVMELVKGVPITRYCDNHRLPPRTRLELFVTVCQAVQHAHQKGIIHRDIKPSNVLVAPYDGKPVVKVIDFGIAKAAGQPLTDKTLFTGIGTVVGTPEYMSPEQAELNNQDIDTRSDVYSLGVLLYELLTGTTPLTRKRLKEAALLEVLRLVREEEPPRPSTRLSSTDELPSVAANRGLEPRRLTGLVRGELDWVVMKSLEKDRNRRYESATGFAEDLQRYLSDEPVLACPPSAWYRVRKFARRNRAGLLTLAAMLLVGLVAVGGIGWARWDRAALQESQRREHAARRAETERAVSVALARAEQLSVQARQMPSVTSLEAGAALVVWRQAADALAPAAAALTTGDNDDLLRERVTALAADLEAGRLQTEGRRASALRKENLFHDLDEARLARSVWVGDQFDNAASTEQYKAAFTAYGLDVSPDRKDELARRIGAEELEVRDALIGALDDWAGVAERGQMKGSAKDLRELALRADHDTWRRRYFTAKATHDGPALRNLSTEARRSSLPPSNLILLAWSLTDEGDHEECLTLLRWGRSRHPRDFWLHFELGNQLQAKKHEGQTAVEREEAIGCFRAALALRPETIAVLNNLGEALRDKGQLDEAIAAYCEAIRLEKDFPFAHCNLGIALRDKGKLDEAIVACREAIRLKKDYAEGHNGLGYALYTKGQLDEAIAAYREAIRLKKDHTEAHNNLGVALATKGQLDEAIAAYREAIRLKKDLAEAHNNLGVALATKGQLDEALAAYREAIRLKKDYANAHLNLGNALRDKGQLDEAIAAYGEAIRLKKDLAEAHNNLGVALRDKGQLDEALAAYREAIRLKKDYAKTHNNLGLALRDKGELDEAIAAFREAIRLKKDYAEAHFNLGVALATKGQLDEALAAYREAIRLNKDSPEAHCNVGLLLVEKGEFLEALKEVHLGHQLGSRIPGWRNPSALWVQRCERLVELDGKLPTVLEGKTTPASPAERIELAELCSLKRLNHAAARFWEEALAAQPRLADDLDAQHRYNAACAAALAAGGAGTDAANLDTKERTRLRHLARDWLRADLEARSQLLDKQPKKAPAVAKILKHWLDDPDFADVRRPEALAKLPKDEQKQWRALWDEIANLSKRAQEKTSSGKLPPPK